MKRILTIEDLVSIGKRGESVSNSIFSSFSLEQIFVPQNIKYSPYNNCINKDLSSSFIDYEKSFKDDLIHFDSIYYSLYSTSELNALNIFIENVKDNDTKVIANTCDIDITKIDSSIFSQTNIILASSKSFKGNNETILEELISYSKKIDSISDFIIVIDIYISESKSAIALFNREKNEVTFIYYTKWPIKNETSFDIFSSCFTSHLLNEEGIEKAVRNTLSFLDKVNVKTLSDKNQTFYGLIY